MNNVVTTIWYMKTTCECIDMNCDNVINSLPPVALGQSLHRLLASLRHVLEIIFSIYSDITLFEYEKVKQQRFHVSWNLQ